MNDEVGQITDKICADNPAYIMFTSGSTGFPKGAVMTHQNLLNFINWGKQTYDVTPDDIFTNVNPMYFDNSVFDFYVSLFNGATLAPFNTKTVKHPKLIVDKVEEIKATIWFSVPSLLVFLLTLRALDESVFINIRVITFGGEGFPKTKLKKLYNLYKDQSRIVNVYGPTECTCICSAYDINETDFEHSDTFAPLGFIAPNFDYLILDEKNQPSKKGELALIGPQVGLGYYNDPERTQLEFIQNPTITNYKSVIYKTGDLVSEDEAGVLTILGRTDNQIKHMGYRIELEEIEAGINSISYVNESCVAYKKIGSGLGELVAFVSTNEDKTEPEILSQLKSKLTSYMIPRKIIFLEVLPKNKNGKIDRVTLKNKL